MGVVLTFFGKKADLCASYEQKSGFFKNNAEK
jgi:hypothetical protein